MFNSLSTTKTAAIIAVLGIILLAASAPAQQPAAPRAVVPVISYSFGDIYKGETISYIFPIHNEGGADLLITDFVGACGCEVLGVDRVIAPGKDGSARIEINTASQPGGELFKTAILHTNDLQHPAITFTLVGNVLAGPDGGPLKSVQPRAGKHIGPVFVGPSTTGGFVVAPGAIQRFEFTITVERPPLSIVGVEGGLKTISARLETIEPGKRYKVIVENLSTAAEGTHQGQLRVITDSPLLPAFPLNLRIIVRANL